MKSKLTIILLIILLSLAFNFSKAESEMIKNDFITKFWTNYYKNFFNYTKKKNRRSCKDSRALNFTNYGYHDESVCIYPWGWGEKKSEKKENEIKKENKICRANIIIFEKMEFGDKDYRISKNTGKRITEIRLLKRYLKKLDLYDGKITGFFDKELEKAVKEMQKQLNIPTTGKIDDKTLEKLKECRENNRKK